MTATVLYGKPVASVILTEVRRRATWLAEGGIVPRLVFVTVGQAPDAQMYLSRLERLGTQHGVKVLCRDLHADVSLRDLDDTVAELNEDDQVDGIIVQMPLPAHLTPIDLSNIIRARKDVDGISIENAGRLYLGMPAPTASTGMAMVEILNYAGINPTGQHCVIIGRSQVVGHPVAELLLHRDATVTVTHRQTYAIERLTRLADILLVAAGEPHLVTADMVRPGAVVIDAGITVTPRGPVGDVDFDACLPVASAITPVPGGVGPVTNAVLLRNVVDSAERRAG